MFVERVDPLIKFVHVPSLHKHILQAAWDPRALSRAHQALVFSIYVLATTSVPPSECATTFGEPRSSMLQRHRAAALRALVAADVFSTRDFDVLQALVLYLFSDPESALSSTLMAVAVKVAQILGLPAAGLAGVPGGEGEQGQLSVFESEVRLRLLWQLRGLDVRTAAIALLPARPLTAPADVTFGAPPLNVNDADLHPAMTEPPIPHRGPTEMLLPLVKYEFAMWFKSAPTGRLIIQSFHSSSTGPAAAPRPSVRELDAAIDDLERHGVVRDRPLDDRVPLQALVRYMVAHHVSSVRFKVHHPRRLLGARGRGVATTDADTSQTMDQRELDCLFDWGLDMLESRVAVARSNFATHLYIHMTSRLDMDALIYVVAELRHREATPKVNRAWELVHGLFSDCETVLLEAEGPFYTALGDLVLDSWDSRMQGMLPDQTPSYIQTLRAARAERDGGAEQSEFARQDMYDWDGTYWSSFFNFQ